jgi:methionyl-tRNA formyltransferase
MSDKVGVVYVTCGQNGIYGLRYLLSKSIRIEAVVTIRESVAARYNVSGFVDVSGLCKEHGVKQITLNDYVLKPDHLAGLSLDLLVVNGWNRLVSKEVIDLFRLGGIGVHAGHPPIGLGRAPLPWNIIKGYEDIEAYVFSLTEAADDGDIVGRRVIEISKMDNVKTLYEKVMYFGAFLIEKAIRDITRGEVKTQKQAREYTVYFEKRTPEDGIIDFRDSMENIYNFIRAQTDPYPGAYTYLEGEKWIIWKAIPFDRFGFRGVSRVPGKIVAALPSGIVVQTGSSPLWITSAACNGRTIIPDSIENMENHIGKVFSMERVGRM